MGWWRGEGGGGNRLEALVEEPRRRDVDILGWGGGGWRWCSGRAVVWCGPERPSVGRVCRPGYGSWFYKGLSLVVRVRPRRSSVLRCHFSHLSVESLYLYAAVSVRLSEGDGPRQRGWGWGLEWVRDPRGEGYGQTEWPAWREETAVGHFSVYTLVQWGTSMGRGEWRPCQFQW